MAGMEKTNKVWPWLALAIAVIILDQVTKQAILSSFAYGERLNLLPVFDLTLVYNYGAAWSFLSDAGGWQRWFFTVISAVVSIILIVWIWRLARDANKSGPAQTLLLVALSLILGGAVGNLIDRAIYGYVIDFLLVYYQEHHFPVFNVADSAITIGAGFLILDAFYSRPSSSSEAESRTDELDDKGGRS